MSKASEYARRLAAADEARVDDLILGGVLQVGLTFKGEMYIKSACANSFSPVDALRLRDWITENFGEEND